MTTRASRICGDDNLGISSDVMNGSGYMHGKIPIPPVMAAQIDLIQLLAVQLPLKVLILDQLQKIVLANKPSNWFCIYLCVFILLHNYSLIIANDAWYARKNGLKVSARFYATTYTSYALFSHLIASQTRFAKIGTVEDLLASADILLAYFHYCTKGQMPFDLDWNAEENTSMAELNPEQVQFVRNTANYVMANRKFNTFSVLL